jgi:glutamate carboxypeptidase
MKSLHVLFTLAIGLVGLAPSPGATAQLNDDETKLRNYAREHTENAVRLLKVVVDINSGSLNVEGVTEVGRILRAELDALGFETRWVELPAEMKRAGHLFAERKGDQGKKLLLIGHLDTVYEKDSPFQTLERAGDLLKGPGVDDMKGGDVTIVYALKALHHIGALNNTNLIVAMTGDEEKTGKPLSVTRAELLAAARRSDLALGFEGSVGAHDATIARRGASGWILRVDGKMGHSSQIFGDDLGAGAIFETSRILSTFYQELVGEQYLTFNAGVMLGGTEVDYDPETAGGTASGKTNVVPQTVVVHGGLRFISEEQRERARQRMQDIVARGLPETSATIEFADGYPGMAPTDGNRALFERFDQVSRDLGYPALDDVDPGARGAADISFVAPIIDALAGLGPNGTGAHATEESLEVEALTIAIERAAVFLYRLTR